MTADSSPDERPEFRQNITDLICEKTRGLIPWRTTEALEKCGHEEIYQTCSDCGRFKTHFYRCSLKFCPNCNWLISRKRTQLIGLWAKRITQPKHVILTARNTNTFAGATISKFGEAVSRLQRTKLFHEVAGGCCSFEVTNEGRGWHLHAHLLLDVRWMDGGKLALAWAEQIGQDFAIVKVKDARQKEYLDELCKYVCKPEQMSKWRPSEIAAFILAIRKRRFFKTFGSLYDFRADVKEELRALRPEPKMCACGCGKFRFESERSSILREYRMAQRR
jgi:hypothetical protein